MSSSRSKLLGVLHPAEGGRRGQLLLKIKPTASTSRRHPFQSPVTTDTRPPLQFSYPPHPHSQGEINKKDGRKFTITFGNKLNYCLGSGHMNDRNSCIHSLKHMIFDTSHTRYMKRTLNFPQLLYRRDCDGHISLRQSFVTNGSL